MTKLDTGALVYATVSMERWKYLAIHGKHGTKEEIIQHMMGSYDVSERTARRWLATYIERGGGASLNPWPKARRK